MQEKAKKITALICAAALTMALCGCGRTVVTGDGTTEGKNDGGSVSAAAASDGKFSLFYDGSYSLNPMKATDDNNQLVCGLIYENMVTVNNAFTLQAGVVTKWESTDGKTWTFTVDPGAHTFSNGTSVTAKDAAYSLRCAINNQRFENRFSGRIAAIEAVDDATFTVTLNKAESQFPMLMTVPVIQYNTVQNTYPIGSGPYTYAQDHQSLTANTHYAGADGLPVGAVYLQKYTSVDDFIIKFEDSTVDLVPNDPSASTNLGFGSSNETRSFNTTNLHFIGFNLQSKFFQSRELQYAFTFAFDRKYMANTLMQGNALAACAPINPASPLYNKYFDQTYSYDLEQCKTVLAQLGVEDYDDDGMMEYMIGGAPVELDINFAVCSDSGVKVSMAEKFALDMKGLGITVTVKKLNYSDYKAALTAGTFDMYYGEVRLSPDFDLSCLLASGGSANYSRETDSENAALIDAYLAAGDDSRRQACDDMCSYIAQTAAIIPICFEKHQIITHKGVITGMTVNQNEPLCSFAKWKINI